MEDRAGTLRTQEDRWTGTQTQETQHGNKQTNEKSKEKTQTLILNAQITDGCRHKMGRKQTKTGSGK